PQAAPRARRILTALAAGSATVRQQFTYRRRYPECRPLPIVKPSATLAKRRRGAANDGYRMQMKVLVREHVDEARFVARLVAVGGRQFVQQGLAAVIDRQTVQTRPDASRGTLFEPHAALGVTCAQHPQRLSAPPELA